MKFKGHKIGGITYLVTDADIEKSGSLEYAAKAAKEKRENPKPEKSAKAKKVVEQLEESTENV